MKKLIALALALTMIFSAATVFVSADESEPEPEPVEDEPDHLWLHADNAYNAPYITYTLPGYMLDGPIDIEALVYFGEDCVANGGCVYLNIYPWDAEGNLLRWYDYAKDSTVELGKWQVVTLENWDCSSNGVNPDRATLTTGFWQATGTVKVSYIKVYTGDVLLWEVDYSNGLEYDRIDSSAAIESDTKGYTWDVIIDGEPWEDLSEESSEESREEPSEEPWEEPAANLALGRRYTITDNNERGDGWDDWGGKLTDGVYAKDASADFVGFQATVHDGIASVTVTVDLGKVKHFNKITADATYGDWGISAPAGARFSVSKDGRSFSDEIDVATEDASPLGGFTGEWKGALYEARGSFDARYVRITYYKTDDTFLNHIWTSEITVENGDNIPGDVDEDGKITSDDAVYLLRAALFPELYPLYGDCDFYRDGKVNTDDAVYLLRHFLFPEEYPLNIPTADKYFNFGLLEDGTYEIARNNDIDLPEEIVIPSEHNGKAVTHIGSYAFNSCRDLTKVIIPDSITSIGYCAFGECTGLINVDIPNSVIFIEPFAFYCCAGLTGLNIPESVTFISNDSFSGCTALESIMVSENNPNYHSSGNCLIDTNAKTLLLGCKNSVIPDDGSVTIIGGWAFSCTAVTNVTIPDSVAYIGEWAFAECANLAEIIFAGTEEQWNAIDKGDYWDENTGDYTVIFLGDQVRPQESEGLEFTLNGDGVSYFVSAIGTCTDTDIVIPSEHNGLPVTSIGDQAFESCISLTSVTIPDSVTSIGNEAFESCINLVSVAIPDSVTSIGGAAFRECTGLTSVNIPDGVTCIRECTFYYCTSLVSVTIPDGVLSIGEEAFWCCISLTSGTIPVGVTSIGYEAFYGCTGLTNVTIPDSVTSMGERAFYDCTGLTSATIGSGVTSIGYRTFYNCTGLTSVTIGSGVTSIGESAFENCNRLTSVTIGGGVTTIKGHAFYGCTKLTDIYYIGTASQWISISISAVWGWNDKTGDYVVRCTDGIFDKGYFISGGLKFVVADKEGKTFYVAGLGDGFSGSELVIPETVSGLSVTSIGSDAFFGCTGLTSVTIPNSVTSIGIAAFADCSGIETIVVETSNPVYHSAGNCIIHTESGTLVAGCKNSVIPLDGSVTGIDIYAFNCTGITSITIPDSVTYIGESAFAECANLAEIIFAGTEEQWNAIDKGDYWDENTGDYTVIFLGE